MTRLENTAETGLSDGTTVTLANSDDGSAGDAFATVTIGSGAAAITYESAAALHGSLGIREQFSNSNTFVRLGSVSGPFTGSTLACRFYFRHSAVPGQAMHFGRILGASAGVILQFRLNANGTFQVLNSVGSGIGTSGAIAADTVYRIEAWVTPATSTTGRVSVRLFAGEDTASPILSIDLTNTNLGTQAPAQLEMGRSTGNVSIFIDYDSMVADDGIGETYVGPVAPGDIVAEPGGIASGEAFGTPAAEIPITGSPSGIATGEAFGTPAASLALTAAPSGIASGEAFGTPTAALALTASPSGVPSEEAFGSTAADAALTASPPGIVGEEGFGSPVADMALTALTTGIPSAEGFGTPEALVASGNPSPDGIPSGEAFGTPAAVLALTAEAGSIGSAEAFGDAAVVLALTAEPVGIPTGEAFGDPALIAALIAEAEGIASGEAFGTPEYDIPTVDVELELGAAFVGSFTASVGAPGFTVGAPSLSAWEAGE